jgi:predicted TIM-barrel fold metal-dependent hydrolase
MPRRRSAAVDAVDAPSGSALSRRALLGASAGLVGTAAVAPTAALAQAPARAPDVLPIPPGPPFVIAVQAPVRPDWLARHNEPILEPDLPIIDPHHHLWDRPGYRYLMPELLADVGSGHNVRATMFEQARSMYRADGPEELKSLGETEFVSGAAAMSAAGIYGPTRCIAGIVAFVDLRLGARAKGLLERHIAVSDGRVRGIRNGSTWSDDPVLKAFTAGGPKGLLLDKTFREGFAALASLSLTFDAWMFQTQLSDLVDLARAFPQTTIVLNHVGGPLAVGPYAGKRDEAFADWRSGIQQVASFPNTYVKLGGLGMKMIGFDFFEKSEPPSSEELAQAWRPYIETCIAAFGPHRSMFESNFPVDKGTCSYPVLWNAFKRIAAGHSADEKAALFGGAAKSAYRLQV